MHDPAAFVPPDPARTPDAAVPPGAGVTAATLAAPGGRHVSWRHYLWIVGALAVVAAMLHWLGPVLTPFLIGIILAYIGTPIVNRLKRMHVPRTLATVITVLLFILLMLAVVFVVLPLVQQELALLFSRLPLLADFFATRIAPWLEEVVGVTVRLDLATMRDLIADNAQEAGLLGMRLLGSIKTGGLFLLAVLVNAVLVPVVMFYLLRDGRIIAGRLEELIPRRWDPLVRGIGHEIDHVLSEFLHGQMLLMLALAAYYVIALSVAGLRFAIPIGVLTGLLVFVPYVGFGTGFVLGLGAALLQWNGWPGFLAIMVVYGIGQLLENYVLLPYLVGDRIGLHPLAVIFALLAFGQLFGFAGVLLALPIAASLLVALRRVRAAYFESPIYRA